MLRISDAEEGIISYYDDMRIDAEYDDVNYFVVNLIEDIEQSLREMYEETVIESLKNDDEYKELEDEYEQDEYIEKNEFDRFIDLSKKDVNKIYENVVAYFEKLNYDCYNDTIFPANGCIKSLNGGQIAFVKKDN